MTRFSARSLLFVPGDSERKLAKGLASAADLLLLDLEDSVAAAQRPQARQLVATTLGGHRPMPLWVRINPLDGPDALADLAAIVPARPDGIMLPKATPDEARQLHHYLSALEVAAGLPQGAIATMVVATETAEAVFRLGDYRDVPRLAALTWGAEDAATALGATHNRDETGALDFPYRLFQALCLTGAVAARVPPIETIFGDFRNAAALESAATAARRMGFRGMMAIHPDQVPIINRCFSPTAEEIARAERIVAAFAANPDAGVLGLDGEMLDRPHLTRAEQLLKWRRD